MSIDWKGYAPAGFFDELFSDQGVSRAEAEPLISYLQSLSDEEVIARKNAAEATIREMGVSFTVYTEGGNIDRAWPFDILPRVIGKSQWEKPQRA